MRNLIAVLLSCLVVGRVGAGDRTFDFRALVNDVSAYKNFFDSGASGGHTLQVISINQIKLKWWFQVEFTADFNRHLNPGHVSDYYLEAGVLKYVLRRLAVNYQRVHGTLVGKPINQIGVRYSF
ncbi:MAG: hypothetical protein ONB14_01200 [candidate division KSB1 bacterium]|nr:hypothetical protein [candidate division KSB1 bacterium]